VGGTTGTGARLPAVRPAFGPLRNLTTEVFDLYIAGRAEEALALAERYEPFARAFGDDRTVSFLIQLRLFVHLDLGEFTEGVAIGEALLRRHQAARYVVEEAKTLAELADLYVHQGRFVEGMHHLARSGLLLERCARGPRYLSAVSSLANAANTAELYEFAAPAYEHLADAWAANGLPPSSANHELGYAEMLVLWALRLAHLGHEQDARTRAERAVGIARRWVTDPTVSPGHHPAAHCVLALGLALLGQADEARRVAADILAPARAQEIPWLTRLAHLAYGVSLRAAGDPLGAERELVFAQQWWQYGGREDERLIIGYELAMLDTGAGRHLRAALTDQVRQLWDLRLQRLAMLRQAQHRVELESRGALVERQLLRDPLTGLANRRRFDQVMGALRRTDPDAPTVFLLIDVDKFKAVNDTYSHAVGDAVLRRVADVIGVHCRQGSDVPIRYAGDEFAVFLQSLDLPAGVQVAERICAAVRTTDLDDVSPGLAVTLSIGVAARYPGMTAEDLFRTADERLYQAKRHGRDRVAA
jgi:diguanylate cyclase